MASVNNTDPFKTGFKFILQANSNVFSDYFLIGPKRLMIGKNDSEKCILDRTLRNPLISFHMLHNMNVNFLITVIKSRINYEFVSIPIS